MNILAVGGSGFVGQSLCHVLVERGHEVTVASRSPNALGLPASVQTISVDVRQPDLAAIVDGHDAVVNLVGLPAHLRPRGQTHESTHVGGTRHLLAACEATGVDRYVQLSALGVDSEVRTAFLDARRRGERLVRDASVDWVIYRPSVVIGDGCAFIPFLKRVIPPVVAPLPRGGTMRIQPIWVGDLAPLLADGVDDARHVGATYELGGPEKLTVAAVAEQICGPRRIVPVPMPLAIFMFRLAGYVPGLPFDQDQARVFALDNTTPVNDVTAFGAAEENLLTLGEYLAGEQPPVPSEPGRNNEFE